MYFSVITPEGNSLRRAAYELAQSPYAEHQWLWQFFSGHEEQPRDFIFRRHGEEQDLRFYVVSQRPPTAFSVSWQVQSRSYDPHLLEGQRLSFQLCANPVITKKNSAGKSQRHDVVMQAKKSLLKEHGLGEDAQGKEWQDEDSKLLLYELVQKSCIEWLQARADKNGFSIASANVDAYRKNKAGKRDIQFSTVNFSGELQVNNPVLFQQALFNGIGHSKAFGCGLLLVKHVEN